MHDVRLILASRYARVPEINKIRFTIGYADRTRLPLKHTAAVNVQGVPRVVINPDGEVKKGRRERKNFFHWRLRFRENLSTVRLNLFYVQKRVKNVEYNFFVFKKMNFEGVFVENYQKGR